MHLHAGEARILARARSNGPARDQIGDFRRCQRRRLAELPPGERQGDVGRGFGMRIDHLLRLAAAMADLRPEVIALPGRRLRPAGQPRLHVGIGFALDHDIAGPFEMVRIDDDVARQQHARTTIGPDPVKPLEFGRGASVGSGQPLGHRGLRQPVGQHGAARQFQLGSQSHGHDRVSPTLARLAPAARVPASLRSAAAIRPCRAHGPFPSRPGAAAGTIACPCVRSLP